MTCLVIIVFFYPQDKIITNGNVKYPSKPAELANITGIHDISDITDISITDINDVHDNNDTKPQGKIYKMKTYLGNKVKKTQFLFAITFLRFLDIIV